MSKEPIINLFDLIPFNEAITKFGISKNTLLKEASLDKISIIYPAKQFQSLLLQLCQHMRHEVGDGTFYDPGGEWYPISYYNETLDIVSKEFVINTGDLLKIGSTCITLLYTNERFSLLDLVNELLEQDKSILDGQETEYSGGPLMWVPDTSINEVIGFEDIYVIESEATSLLPQVQTPSTGEMYKPKDSALKVIGLLMHHLAKSPRYASGTNPNKSQIKKLLLELADELDIDDYGLNKVDERLLAEALKYLETQKN